jgi:hypothetical protein
MVIDIERSRPAGRELRLKPRSVSGTEMTANKRKGDDFAKELLGCVKDCHAMVVGRTSRSLRAFMADSGKQFFLTDLFYLDDVVETLAKGRLDDHAERVK